jgi:hypothetical protein
LDLRLTKGYLSIPKISDRILNRDVEFFKTHKIVLPSQTFAKSDYPLSEELKKLEIDIKSLPGEVQLLEDQEILAEKLECLPLEEAIKDPDVRKYLIEYTLPEQDTEPESIITQAL